MFVLIDIGEDEAVIEDGPKVFAAIRSDPNAVSLNTMLIEIATTHGGAGDVFAEVAPKIVTGWRPDHQIHLGKHSVHRINATAASKDSCVTPVLTRVSRTRRSADCTPIPTSSRTRTGRGFGGDELRQ
ncbi:hypothetical protein AB0B25_16610 [Nocardia sp. NPDC049190]|uniref:hypothetical protein n=1 Tax=Nocardia sp. NPDC049190 TaxID=3155650 RepID=UPI0033D6CE8F